MSKFEAWVDMGMGILTNIFGDPVIYKFKPDFDTSLDISGIFEAEGAVIDTSGEIPVETKRPVLCVRKSDFINKGFRLPKKGDWAKVKECDYEIVDMQDDGLTEMRLILMKKGKGSYA